MSITKESKFVNMKYDIKKKNKSEIAIFIELNIDKLIPWKQEMRSKVNNKVAIS